MDLEETSTHTGMTDDCLWFRTMLDRADFMGSSLPGNPRKPDKPREDSWKRRSLSPLTTIPSFVHFFIHTFNKHLLRAKLTVALCFPGKLAS